MLFNSFSYLLFLPTVVMIYWWMPARARKIFLLAASYFFYMSWRPAYGILIFALTLVNYLLGLAINAAAADMQDRALERAIQNKSVLKAISAKSILIAGLVFNLGALCYFKYTNFLLESFFQVLGKYVAFTHQPLPQNWEEPVLNIILPLGISFFTFEFIHYIVDVYRGSKPVKNFIDFALFASFFPSQIAGPIKRFQDFMHQMVQSPAFNGEQFRQGTFLILQGLYKKVVLGDNLSPLVGQAFGAYTSLSLVDSWIAVVGFSFQLYFDFSGYTDIGRGSAYLLGYKVPENFKLPFLAASLTDFWRRWHISLSSWLRDYLFIPMGGSRGSDRSNKRNLILTMVLGGLWHGAAWHFVIWGAVHGFGLVLFKDWHQLIVRSKVLSRMQQLKIWHVCGVIFTNLFVYLAFTVFRASSLEQALAIISRFFGIGAYGFSGAATEELLHSPLMVAIPLYAGYCLSRALLNRLSQKGQAEVLKPIFQYWDRTLPARLVTYAAVLAAIIGFAPSQFSPFIYFQF